MCQVVTIAITVVVTIAALGVLSTLTSPEKNQTGASDAMTAIINEMNFLNKSFSTTNANYWELSDSFISVYERELGHINGCKRLARICVVSTSHEGSMHIGFVQMCHDLVDRCSDMLE